MTKPPPDTNVLHIETPDARSRHRLRQARPQDLSYMKSLSGRHYEEIGWLTPAAIVEYIDAGMVTLAQLNREPAGWILINTRIASMPGTTQIFQAIMQLDARRQSAATALVDSTKRRSTLAGNGLVQLWCKEGLESNEFWFAQGFQPVAIRTGGALSKRFHVLWRYSSVGAAVLWTPPAFRRRAHVGPPLMLPRTITAAQILECSRQRSMRQLYEELSNPSRDKSPADFHTSATKSRVEASRQPSLPFGG